MEENTQPAKEEVVTEVTSVAREEQKTGVKVETPTAEELVARATASYIRNLDALSNIVKGHKGGSYHVSRRGMNRVLLAILQLPMDGMPVTLQGDAEKIAFAVGQRIIADRFLLTQHHISEEMRRLKQEKEAAAQTEAKVESPQTPNEGVTNV